jgi:citrate lyase gamma subunit
VFLTVSQLTGGDYVLTVQNVADLVGNAIQTVVAPFNYIGDITAPQITTVEVSAPSIINVQFSEEVEETSAENLANYGINSDVTILQAAMDDVLKSRVILTTSQLAGGSYELTVQNVTDLAGNVMQTVVIPFSSTGVNEPETKNEITVYPNPAHGTINIDWASEVPGDVVVSLYGIAGIKAYSEHFNINGSKTITIGAENLAGGLYILEVKGTENIYRTKLMVR